MFNDGMKPPISYYGGKQRIANKIIPLIPKHTVYVEPFAGGAAVFFNKPWPNIKNNSDYREVLNDKDQYLTNFYKQLRDNGPELIRRLQLTPYSESEYKLSKQLVCDDPIEAARRYFVNINQSFANKLNGGWGRSVFNEDSAKTWIKRIIRLPEYLDRMSGVNIACDDAINIIKKWDSPQTFFYCDPPYPGTDCGHYNKYTISDFKPLIDTLNQCQGSFILSNYEQPNIEFPENWERYEISATMSAKGRVGYDRSKKGDESEQKRKRTEIVWKRSNTVPIRTEINKLFDKGIFDCFTG